MKFSVPVTRHTTGWVRIEAINLAEAKKIAKQLGIDGLTTEYINDPEDFDEVESEDVQEIIEESEL
jgi:Mg2+ and Co2+ transporter CorA